MGGKINKGTYTIDVGKLIRDCGYTHVEYDNSSFTINGGDFKGEAAEKWYKTILAAATGRTVSLNFDSDLFTTLGSLQPDSNIPTIAVVASTDDLSIRFASWIDPYENMELYISSDKIEMGLI